VRPSAGFRGLWLRTFGWRVGAWLCVSDRRRSRFDSIAAGGNVGSGHPRAASSVGCSCLRGARQLGCRGITARWSSGVSSSLGVAMAKVAFGSSESPWLQVGSELASDTRTGRRGGGNTFEQLDRVSSERAPER
jgi:hypothetical protein